VKAFRVLGRFSFEFQSVARRSFAVLSSIGRLAYIVDGIGTPGIRKGSRRMEGFSMGVVSHVMVSFPAAKGQYRRSASSLVIPEQLRDSKHSFRYRICIPMLQAR